MKPNIATMNFKITKIYGMWQQVKKCRWENGNKKKRRSSKEWELKYNILQREILTTYEGKEMIFLKNNY
jgi:hypothetical protein